MTIRHRMKTITRRMENRNMELSVKQKKMVTDLELYVVGGDIKVGKKKKYEEISIFASSMELALEMAKDFGFNRVAYVSIENDPVIIED